MTLPDIATQIATFFVNSGDTPAPTSVPATSATNTVTPLVDGSNYFGALRQEVDDLKTSGRNGKFFYFTNWLLTLTTVPKSNINMPAGIPSAFSLGVNGWTAFKLDDQKAGTPSAYPDFIDELAAMAKNGVDVKALPWASPSIAMNQTAAEQSGCFWVLTANLKSAIAIRKTPGLEKSVCLNIIGHTLGAMHMKMVVCGDETGGRAYVAGLDFDNRRIDSPGHPKGIWHDVGAKVEGPAVQPIYDHFMALWNEVVNKRAKKSFKVDGDTVLSWVDNTDPVNPKNLTAPAPPTPVQPAMHVQVLRTAPAMNFSVLPTTQVPEPKVAVARLTGAFASDKWSFAPDGIFEFEECVYKAIAAAQQYIYIEDQSFRSWPIMDRLRTALLKNSQLKLIMVHRSDPSDGPNDFHYAATSVGQHLFGGPLAGMNAQVAWAERTDNVTVHAKTWIVDDQLVIIGSANCFRRSQATDAELSIAVLDEDTSSNNLAVRYRTMLWGEHCGLADSSPLLDLNAAVQIWNPGWSVGGAPAPTASPVAVLLPNVFQLKQLPFQAGTGPDQIQADWLTQVSQFDYDRADADSRRRY
jgi:phosphatidylserine/phosphatidylglycerophosphate/cardiolipin synthase-like enzyme